MTKRHLLRRSIAAGATFAVVAAALAVTTGGAAFAGPLEGKVRGARTPDVVKDSYIVVLKDKTANAYTVESTASTLARLHGGTVRQTFASALKGYAAQMSEAQAQRLAARPEVAYVQQNHIVKASAVQANPPSWGLDRIDQSYLPLDNSYTYPTTASNVHAYVVDTGIRVTHSEFGGRAAAGFDAVTTGGTADDCNGHGTHVAGTIGGSTYGVAKGVQLVAVRVLDCTGAGDDAKVIAGIDWVTQHAVKPAVANMSLGGSVSPALNDAVTRSIASGVTYAVAAGNEGWNACKNSPASVPEAITVGATDNTDRRPAFSNVGPCVDVFAPGFGITSSWNTDNSATNTISGTSMAAPHVAGAAALLLAADPTLTPAQVQAAIVSGAVTGAVTNPGVGSPNKLLRVGAATAQPATVIRLRARANGAIVSADGGGGQPLIANRVSSGGWEEFDEVDAGNGYVGLRSHANGRFVTAEAGGASPLIANRTAVGAWEKFLIVTNIDGSISLKANANGRYVTADNGGASPLIANRDAIGDWEKFTVAVPPTVVDLGAYANGRYVSADRGGASPLIANRTAVGQWETFDAVDLGNGYIALRSYANGRFVTADSGGASPLIANRTAVGAWEMFQIATNSDFTIGVKANANGRFVTAEAGGASPLIANRTAVGQWETFELLTR
jgi:subtilisin family serine protease